MVPRPASQTHRRRVCCRAGQFLSCDRGVACGTLYVTVPITWLRISSTRSEWSQQSARMAVAVLPLEPLGPRELPVPVQLVDVVNAPPADVLAAPLARVAHVAYVAHAPQLAWVGDRLAGCRLPAEVVGLLADADHARPGYVAYAALAPRLAEVVGLLADADHAHRHHEYQPHRRNDDARRHLCDVPHLHAHVKETRAVEQLPAALRLLHDVWLVEYRLCKSRL